MGLMFGSGAHKRSAMMPSGCVQNVTLQRGLQWAVWAQGHAIILVPPPPPDALISTTGGVVGTVATVGTMSYVALCECAPLSEQQQRVLFPSNFGTLVLFLQRGGRGAGVHQKGRGLRGGPRGD